MHWSSVIPDGRAVEEGACFIVAEATGEKELVKSFRSAGDLSGSSYTLPRFMKTVFPSKDKFVDLPAVVRIVGAGPLS
jgi:hypothetical protein